MNISNLLIIWFKEHKRELPWKSDKDPYKIWVSEVLLQQTRVEQAKNYFFSFISRFPTVQSLANAPLDHVLLLWQGLGYYSRARNMHEAAKQIVTEFDGQFPRSMQELSRLKGVGPYTAAAIAAFAFDEPVVALDGNGFRIFSRLFAESTPIDTSKGRKVFAALAQDCLSTIPSSIFNQAIMDFGSLVCTPLPKCNDCPLNGHCLAFAQNRVADFPVKRAKKALRNRYFYYLHIGVVSSNSEGLMGGGLLTEYTFIQQRLQKDIWQNLYQFPLIETESLLPIDAIPDRPEWHAIFGTQTPHIVGYTPKYLHRLTHQVLHTYYICIYLEKASDWLQSNCIKIPSSHIDRYGISRLMERYLLDESINHLSLGHANSSL